MTQETEPTNETPSGDSTDAPVASHQDPSPAESVAVDAVDTPSAEPAAEADPSAESPAPEEPTSEPSTQPAETAEVQTAEPEQPQADASEPSEQAAPPQEPSSEPAEDAEVAAPAPEPAQDAGAAPADVDPDAGLGLPDDGVVLGPPNLGGFESGQIVPGKILTVSKREVEVDLGDGKLGVISDRHWNSGSQVDLTSVAKTGDPIEAAVLARADAKKRITLSRLWAQQKRGWETVESAAKDRSDLEGLVTEEVKGGLSLDVTGIRAFMPASLADVEPVADLAPLVGQTLTVRVIEADRNKARLIVSRKAAMRAKQRVSAKEALGTFEVGQQMTGKVAQITDFGAFVEVSGVRGLVHKSEIGWSRGRDPQRDLKVGQEVDVKVLKVQPTKNRLSLSMRLGDDPLGTVKKGDRFEGTVSRLVDFGAFVTLPNGSDGLVHVSEMAEYRVFAPEELVIPGDKVWVKVLKIDSKRRTIDLSMSKAVVPDPPKAETEAEESAEEPAEQAAPSDSEEVVETTTDATEEE